MTFQEVEQGGLLQYGLYSGRTGVPKSPDHQAESYTRDGGSVVWFKWTTPQVADLSRLPGLQLLVHETGHALGLKHPGEYSQYDKGPYLPTELATAANTAMAYNTGGAQHLGAFDLLALQYLYGAPGNAVASNPITVDQGFTYGSYFNDAISFDWHGYTGSYAPVINGLLGMTS